ncbi:acyltransferase [Aeromonas diversa]|uniref:acyltransferase n=1 Tax=Aeromonas diversa TaxID=502790 RepID=UPI0039A1FD81
MKILSLILDRFVLRVSKGNVFSYSGCKIKQSKVRIKGVGNTVSLGKNVRMRNCEININGRNNKLYIGSNCDLVNTKILIDNVGGAIKIGDKTTISGAMIASFEPYEINIGDDCMISYDVEIRNTDSHKIISRKTGERINPGKPIHIGDHVWIGARSVILKGSSIQHDSIVGTNSIVTGFVPEYVIVAGQPAKVIKGDISWNRESVIPE